MNHSGGSGLTIAGAPARARAGRPSASAPAPAAASWSAWRRERSGMGALSTNLVDFMRRALPPGRGTRPGMEHRNLGTTGVQVSPLCLGAMMFGAWGTPDHDESVRIIHRALDAGINFIDTADVYSRGESEEIVAKALAGGRRDHVVLATKVH